MIIVFTGNGKGKTTAALGQAARALGQGKKVLIIQFIKNVSTGEHKFFKQSANRKAQIVIKKTGKGFVKILGDKLPFSEHKKAAQKALKLAAQKIKSKKYDLIILDEINVAVNLKLLKATDILKIIKNLPEEKVIILTGRNAPKSFIKVADIATEMKEIKHQFKKGRVAKKGIEY